MLKSLEACSKHIVSTTCSGIKAKEKGAEDEKHPLEGPVFGTSTS